MKILDPDSAGRELRSGGVALIPTDTVVGLVAGGSGLQRLAEIKRRDPGKPIALLCSSADEAFSRAGGVPPLARELARRLWPGPLTLVLDLPGGGTVGLRVPDHAVIREVISAHDGPVHATSANLSGEPAPGSVSEVSTEVSRAVDFAVEGASGGGEASAVVDLSGGGARLLRENGSLTGEEFSRLSETFE